MKSKHDTYFCHAYSAMYTIAQILKDKKCDETQKVALVLSHE